MGARFRVTPRTGSNQKVGMQVRSKGSLLEEGREFQSANVFIRKSSIYLGSCLQCKQRLQSSTKEAFTSHIATHLSFSAEVKRQRLGAA